MGELSNLIDSLEVKFFKLNQRISILENQNAVLSEKLQLSKQTEENQEAEIATLNSEIERLKMVNSLLGSDENKRETKLKINSLIREIDNCITQLLD